MPNPEGRDNQLDDPEPIREIGGIVIDAAISFVKQMLMKWLVKAVPFLGSGPIGWIAGLAVGWIASKVVTAILKLVERGIIVLQINTKVDGQVDDYVEAVEEVKNAKTKEEKIVAKKKLDKSFIDLINLN